MYKNSYTPPHHRAFLAQVHSKIFKNAALQCGNNLSCVALKRASKHRLDFFALSRDAQMCSEWVVGDAWLGANSGAMLLATAYVLLAGSHLEWCIIQRTRRLVRLMLALMLALMFAVSRHPQRPSRIAALQRAHLTRAARDCVCRNDAVL